MIKKLDRDLETEISIFWFRKKPEDHPIEN